MPKDRNIYFWIEPLTFDFEYQGQVIAQFFKFDEALNYITAKIEQGYSIKPGRI